MATNPSPRADHPLFQRHPLGQRSTSLGMLPFPYHIYDGRIVLIGASANLAAVKTLLRDQQVTLVETETGRALMAVWVCDFTDASLGAHQELQISFFVTEGAHPPVTPLPLGILKLISLNPEIRMLCHGIWNNTVSVVAYNRELCGLDAYLAQGDLALSPDQEQKSFRFTDPAGKHLLEGQVHLPPSQPGGVSFALMRTFGLLNSFSAARQPYVSLQVVNPLSERMPRHMAAQTYTKSDRQVISFFDPARDRLDFGDPRYQNLDCTPQFVNYSTGIRFVYLEPHPLS